MSRLKDFYEAEIKSIAEIVRYAFREIRRDRNGEKSYGDQTAESTQVLH